jgi:hypothetical protein
MCGLTSFFVDRNATAETKITNLNLAPVETDEDVGRLQISVYHMTRMHGHKAKQDLRCEASDLLVGENHPFRVDKRVKITIHELDRNI